MRYGRKINITGESRMPYLLNELDLHTRLANISCKKAKLDTILCSLESEREVSQEVRQAYQLLACDALNKLEREIHDLWLCMCHNGNTFRQRLGKNPNEPDSS